MIKIIVIAITVLLFSACAPKAHQMPSHMNNASIGMTKHEVIQVMGQPSSVSAISGTEYLIYDLCGKEGGFYNDWRCARWDKYFIRLKGGKVDAYGRQGDFDSTKVPETKQTVDINIDHR